MKIFVYDHACGASRIASEPPYIVPHGDETLLRAVLADLLGVRGVELIVMRAAGAPAIETRNTTLVVPAPGEFQQCFDACLDQADAVWLLAPESGGMLERLARTVLGAHRILLGCQPDAVRMAASKAACARALAKAGMATVPTYVLGDALPEAKGGWVVKPDLGADCADIQLFPALDSALAWMVGQRRTRYVLQPFIQGKPGSLTLLCCDGHAWLLSRDEPRVVVTDNQLHYLGCTVNGAHGAHGAQAGVLALAQAVARAMPGLFGCVGIDFLMTEAGPLLLEVNPRATSAYAGLHASIRYNPAELVLRLVSERGAMALPPLDAVPVSVDGGAFMAP